MAFSNFGNQSMGSPAGGDLGPELESITTEGLGFSALAGDAKVQLLPTAWPIDQLPPAFASLMSIASRKGLIAAAGPDAVIVAKTKSVRKAFEGGDTGDNNMKAFTPELTLPMPMRISQLAFSSDEAYLVLSAENGGGLAVYDVDAILNGSTQSAFELSTNGAALRALTPNPTQGELLAVVTADGNLMMANLKDRSFAQGPNGQVLKNGVSCVSWSTKGKQLVAGLGDGSAYQMTPDGAEKATIPRPSDVDGQHHVSSLTWLENNVFLIVHTPTQSQDPDMAPESMFHLATRAPPTPGFKFQKIEDPAGPYGVNRSPPHYFILRLKDFPPNLQDVLFVTSSAASDVGLLSRSKTPLTSSIEAEKVTGVFTMTGFADDARRAPIPVSGGMSDTSPIGLALDLSGDEKVYKPIPSEDINESATPLPAVMVLNHEGALAAWWFVYSESVRQGTAYPGLIAVGGGVTQPTATPTQSSSSFGGSASNNTAAGSGFATLKPATPNAFGLPATSSPSTTGAFGATSGLGQKSSPWGAPPASSTPQTGGTAFAAPAFGSAATLGGGTAFGKPAFGATSTPSAFGASSMPGRQSVWGSSGSTAPQATFGQAGGIAKPAAPFGSSTNAGSSAPSTGGFASFASAGGFAAAAQNKPATNPFGAATTSAPTTGFFGGGAQTENKPTPSIFAQGDNKPGSFGAVSQTDPKPIPSIFGSASQVDNKPTPGLFGGENKPLNSTGFSLGTTFKADEKSANDNVAKKDGPQSSFFGSGFAGALGEKPAAETPVSNEADMDSDEVAKPSQESTTPAATPATNKFQQPSTASSLTGLFGSTPTQPPSTSTKPFSAGFSFATGDKPSGLNFSNLAKSTDPAPKTPIATEPKPIATSSATPATPKIKKEPDSNDHGGIGNIPEPPLPPESTSKTSYAAGESSDSSFSDIETDSPIPSGSIPKSVPPTEPPLKPIPKDLIPPMDVPGGPEDDGGSSDFITEDEDGNSQEGSEEGSGEDMSKDLSSASETNQTPGFTPQGSFNLLKKQNSSSLFEKIEMPKQPGPRLFGEGSLAPSLPPPKPKAPLSPRSPSPVRGAVPPRMFRPDASRSVSAPGAASQLLGHRQSVRPPSSSNSYALQVEQQKAEEKRREESRARKEAEETRALVDEEDDEMQKYLAEDPTPSRMLVEFVAHTDHVNLASVNSIPAQVEAVYRDINSMIDTLGQNAKHLQGFMKAHTEQFKDQGRDKTDLEQPDDWVLVEVENLSSLVENDLARDLENGRVKDVAEKLEACHDLQKDLIRLRAKHEDIKRIIDAQRDPGHLAQARAQPLSAEQLAQQNDLRQHYTTFQKRLSEAEQALTLLKTRVVSHATSNGRTGGSVAPTVDAVMRTITKMTSMAEKQSGNIDVLESQLRKMRLSSTVSAGSREGTPSTPQMNKQSLRNPGTSSTYGLFYTPESTRETPRNFRDSILSNSGSFAMSSPAPRKKLSGYSPEEKAQLRSKLARRKEVVDRLKGALQKAGSNVRPMDDDK